MKHIVFLLLCFVTICANAIVVVDAGDGSAVGGATVFSRSGMILGLTADDGTIAAAREADFPLSVRCIGYEPLDVAAPADTVRLIPAAYELKDVVVSPGERPVMRLVCYAREYSSGITGADTLQLYCEYMTESFLVDGKLKGYKKEDARPSKRNWRRYARIMRAGRDTVFRPAYDDDIAMLSWFDNIVFIPNTVEVPETLLAGAEADSVPGKYSVKTVRRLKNNILTLASDGLADHENHRWSPLFFKMMGLTAEIEACTWTNSFVCDSARTVGIRNFVKSTYNVHINGRGKWFKKAFKTKEPIEMDTYIELYPVDIEYLTLADYKTLRDAYEIIPFRRPSPLAPLSPSVATLLKKSRKKK